MLGYQLKINMRESTPPVWRRVIVPRNLTFEQLHDTIQELFGWMDYHMFKFHMPFCKTDIYQEVDDYTQMFSDMDCQTSEEYLADYFVVGKKISYVYDFGDAWTHDITIEKEMEMLEEHPVLVKWKGDNFAEDAGNTWGYYDIVDIANNPQHGDHKEMQDWLKMQHRPFDPKEVQSTLDDIEAISFYVQPVLEQNTENELSAVCKKLRKELMKNQREYLQIFAIDHHQQTILYTCSDRGDADSYDVQIYESEAAYYYGFQNMATNPQQNTYCFGYDIIFSRKMVSMLGGWSCMNKSCTIKKMHPGYFAYDVNEEEAKQIIVYLQNLVYALQHAKKGSPNFISNKMTQMKIREDATPQISYVNLPVSATLPDNIPDQETMKSMKRNKNDLYIDLLSYPSEDCDYTHEMDLLFIIECKQCNEEFKIQPSQISNLASLKKQMQLIITDFMVRNGKNANMYVNNKVLMHVMQSYCDALHITLQRKEFMTTVQENYDSIMFAEEQQMLSFLEEILPDELLDTLNPDDVEEFLDNMKEDDLANFTTMVESFLNGVENNDMLVLPEKGKKKFDA